MTSLRFIFLLAGVLLIRAAQAQDIRINKLVGDFVMGNKNEFITKQVYNTRIINNKIIVEPADKQLVSLGVKVGIELLQQPAGTQLKEKADTLLLVCIKSLDDELYYKKNKGQINRLVAEICRLQNQQVNALKKKAIQEYQQVRIDLLDNSLAALKSAADEQALLEALSLFHQMALYPPDSLFIEEYLPIVVKLLPGRLKQTRSAAEIDRLFSLDSALVVGDLVNKARLYQSINSAITPDFAPVRRFLGENLLEGYKKYLQKNKRFNPTPDFSETKSIYQFLVMASDPANLETNVLLSQSYLFDQGFLACNDSKVNAGWNAINHPKQQARIPSDFFTRKLTDIYAALETRDGLYNINNGKFKANSELVRAFDQKVIKFERLPGMNWTDNDLVKLLSVFRAGLKTYERCPTCNNVYFQLN